MRRSIACRMPSIALVLPILAGGVLALPTSSQAISEDELLNDLAHGFLVIMALDPLQDPIKSKATSADSPEAASIGWSTTYRLINFNADTEPGEPAFGGRMKKTVWAKLKPVRKQRVVVHTFGSDYDTALAVHTGNKVDKLKTVVFNDNHKVAGLSGTASLVQFDAKKGVQYSVQIGSKTGAEGNVYASVSVFPPTGGLTAHLARVDTSPWQGRDYVCQLGSVPSPRCGAPTFLLHNSTGKTVKVTATTDLDPDIGPPGVITLAPGATATAAFTIGGGFDSTTARTVPGHFTFTARRGQKVISEARVRGLVVVKPGSPPAALKAEVSPQAKAGLINEPHVFKVKLTNIGTAGAKGCHARTSYLGFVAAYTRVGWQQINPNSGKPVGAANAPINIPPKKARWIGVTVASMQSRVADLTLPIPVVPDLVIDCNNTQEVAFDHKNRFDITARGGWRPAKVATAALAPKGDVLNVPKNGSASFRVSVLNSGPAAPLIAWPSYVRPFDDSAPNKQFAVAVCQTKTAKSACLAPPSSEVQYEAKKGKKSFFRVTVKAAKVDPGFDPTQRRVFLVLSHRKPDGHVGTSRPSVAAQSVAPKRG